MTNELNENVSDEVRLAEEEPVLEYGAISRDLEDFSAAMLGEHSAFRSVEDMISEGKTEINIHLKEVRNTIDESWIKAIEDTLSHLDLVMRRPRIDIKEIEDVKRIELSRKINSQSIRDLALHADYINSYDEENETVKPSKILNVYREDNEFTYENKFINTLIRRLSFFIDQRLNGMKGIIDEKTHTMEITSHFKVANANGKYTMKLELTDREESQSNLNIASREIVGKNPLVARILKIKRIIDDYKGSEFIKRMGEKHTVRPPIVRTNAITKNKDLRACLTLWEFLGSYGTEGYTAKIDESNFAPDERATEVLAALEGFQYAVFRHQALSDRVSEDDYEAMLYDYHGVNKHLVKKEGEPLDGEEATADAEGTSHGMTYVTKDDLSSDEKELLKTLNAALEAEIIYEELLGLRSENIAGYFSLGLTLEQVRELAVTTGKRRNCANR